MPVDESPRGPRRVPSRPWILLLVDDEPDILDAVGDLIEYELPGVKVLRASSGPEGLGALQQERVDGIISDYNMPQMDGIEFLVIARQCHPTIPRVMLTAIADPALVRMAHEDALVRSFLPKHAGVDELLDRVCADLLDYEPAIRPAP